jgi:GAF domain-containing protein
VAASGEPAWIVDAMRDENFPRRYDLPGGGVHGAFGLPILLGTEVVAVVEIFTDRPKELDGGLLSAAGQIGVQLGRVVERARAREKISHQGLHGGLTGLPTAACSSIASRARWPGRAGQPPLPGSSSWASTASRL